LRNRRFILFLSRIDRKKGCNLLIEAFARIADSAPDLVLVMAGPDNSGWQAELQALAGGLHVADRIVWTGPLAGSLKWAAFRHAEAFALTSHTENFGIVVVEALACGTPVLISDKVNIWREVVDGGAGYVESDTLDGSVQLLNRWLATDLESRRIMSSAAISVFYERFEIKAVAKVIAEELQRCVNREER
jgi:glycosyltransferase involved in cell wall biosynthesis